MRIHPLSNELTSQIAAGEVIERPASVLKELVENSIDSGATQIDIVIEKVGMSLIQVTDNGCGIHPDDLQLTIRNHATSKLSTFDDLTHIASLGFRGEALASMASVADVHITSKYYDKEQAYELYPSLHSDVIDYAVRDAAHATGTTVQVRNLFHRVPARRKFMKSVNVEQYHCDAVVKQMILSHPHIGFTYTSNKKLQFSCPVDGDTLSERRIKQVMGKRFFEHSVEFSVQGQQMNISGYLGLPAFHKSQNLQQYFFLNHRTVKDKSFNHAIRVAYDHLIPEGRYPGYIINLDIPTKDVDVNVHPAKTEVRLYEQRLVHDFISSVLKKVLQQGNDPIEQLPINQSFSSRFHQLPSRGNHHMGLATGPKAPEAEKGIYCQVGHYLMTFTTPPQVIDLPAYFGHKIALWWAGASTVDSKPLLVPQKIHISSEQRGQLTSDLDTFEQKGVSLSFLSETTALLRKMPTVLSSVAYADLISLMLLCRQSATDSSMAKAIETYLRKCTLNINNTLYEMISKDTALDSIDQLPKGVLMTLSEDHLAKWFKV